MRHAIFKDYKYYSHFIDWRVGRWPWFDLGWLTWSNRRILQETWNQEDPFQAGLQSIHWAIHGDLFLSRRSSEVGRDWQQWNLPARNVAADGLARGCQRHCVGIVARKVGWWNLLKKQMKLFIFISSKFAIYVINYCSLKNPQHILTSWLHWIIRSCFEITQISF